MIQKTKTQIDTRIAETAPILRTLQKMLTPRTQKTVLRTAQKTAQRITQRTKTLSLITKKAKPAVAVNTAGFFMQTLTSM